MLITLRRENPTLFLLNKQGKPLPESQPTPAAFILIAASIFYFPFHPPCRERGNVCLAVDPGINLMPCLRLSASRFPRVAAAAFKMHQFIGAVLYKQGELFGERHRFCQIGHRILYSRFFLFGAHRSPSRREA
jgi:hypothetical protein